VGRCRADAMAIYSPTQGQGDQLSRIAKVSGLALSVIIKIVI
jgi:hypothetical protein